MKLFYWLSFYFIHITTGVTLLFTGFSCASGETDDDANSISDTMSPTANCVINGKVVSETNQDKGIPDILIRIHVEKSTPLVDTLFTDASGYFEWTAAITTFGDNAKFNISTTDTTGNYKPYNTSLEFSKNDFNTSPTVWFLGEAKKSLLIKLEENTN
ncbi:MAG: radical SAM-associated putative lipoprotein [Tannerellaceae bacterium]|jgi:putative lipoprotein (rSAM/lipoprotein system)|nr:radical SAM-associated putative lipoprotein [Tannerellaceae bacterium]